MSATEIITGCDTRNKYDLYQHESQVLFTAREESSGMDTLRKMTEITISQ